MRYFLCFLVCFFSACSFKNLKEQNTQNPYAKLEFEQNISQLKPIEKSFKKDAKAYKERFFSPWHSNFKNFKNKNVFWAFELYKNPKNKYYFFNKQKIPQKWFLDQIKNANVKNLGKLNQKALIIQNSYLKNLPTNKVVLKDPFKLSEGIPFDYALDSILNIGTPVLISHYTKDKRYAFVFSEGGFGFVESQNLEKFTNQRAKLYENLKFNTPIKEKIAVFDEQGNFFFETRIGAIYPYYKSNKNFYYGKIGERSYKLSKKDAKNFPLEFNEKNFKNQLNQLLSLPYGWGGYDFERDCSLFTRESFAPFGIYMPRNSLAQNNFFKHFNISKLDNKQKQDFIKHFAKPYLTLFYLPGHIMLYVGELKEQNAVIHNIWGLKKSEFDRLLISQSVITSLEIGKNEIPEENLLLSRLKEVSFIQLSKDEEKAINTYLKKF